MPLTQIDLANALGLSPVKHVLQGLRKEGRLDLKGCMDDLRCEPWWHPPGRDGVSADAAAACDRLIG